MCRIKRKDKAYSDKWIFGWFFGNIKKEIKIKKWYQFRYCNFNYWWTRKGMRELYGVKTKPKNRHRRTFLMRHARRFVDEGENVTIYYKKECRVLKSFKHRTKLECGRRGYIYKEPDANNQ